MPKAYWITEKSKLLLEAIDAKLLCLNANGDLPDAEMEKFEKFWNALLLRGIVVTERQNPLLYQHITELRETADLKEIAQMLHSGEWIAICATEKEPYVFSMGRISREQPCQGNK